MENYYAKTMRRLRSAVRRYGPNHPGRQNRRSRLMRQLCQPDIPAVSNRNPRIPVGKLSERLDSYPPPNPDGQFAESNTPLICPACGHLAASGVKFCPECGTNLSTAPGNVPLPEQTFAQEHDQPVIGSFSAGDQSAQEHPFSPNGTASITGTIQMRCKSCGGIMTIQENERIYRSAPSSRKCWTAMKSSWTNTSTS